MEMKSLRARGVYDYLFCSFVWVEIEARPARQRLWMHKSQAHENQAVEARLWKYWRQAVGVTIVCERSQAIYATMCRAIIPRLPLQGWLVVVQALSD